MSRRLDTRLLTAAGAAVLGLGGAGLSAMAAGADTTGCTTPTDTQTAPDPTTTTPDPTTCTPASTTTPGTTTTETPPPATTPAAPSTPAPSTPPAATSPAPSPATPEAVSTPTAPKQHRQRSISHHTVRTTTHHHTAVHHTSKRAKHHHHARHHRHSGDDTGLGRGRTLYLPSHLPDPTPPAARVDAGFMRMLRTTAHDSRVDWALLLGVLRANGHQESRPAKAATVRALAREVAGGDTLARAAATATADPDTTARAVALARYYRGVGPTALVAGLEASKPLLIERVLNRPGIDIYPGGGVDVLSGRVNVRVLATILYLRQTFHQVTVSCLITGHRLYARPGVVSAHIYGLAADISELGGVPIAGHQQSGGVTDHAVQDLLRLPILPKQIISLLDLGGPSFALSNHWDHIHVGY
jgi:hypothetical protein